MAGGTAILIKRNISHFHVPTPPLRTGVEATLVALTPNDQEPFMVASIYIPPNPNYRNLSADLDTLFKIFNTAIVAGDYNAKHTSWGCVAVTQEGELKGLIKDRNKARKTWQQTRHPQHKTELNRLQNIIKRKIYHYRQQAWEDNLLTLNAEDNSLWGIAKAFRKKASPISALNGPTGIALSDTNGTRLNDYLEREKILIPEQHGFRPRLSTSHQLLRVIEFIKEGNNKDECTAAVFLDIQKAFDRVLQISPSTIRDFEVKNCYESSGRDWSARSAPIGGERVCLKRMRQSSDDEGDLEPLRKRSKPLSDSDND
ncbi:uncharacterized protein TNCV_1555481 [Trichonephila clavipes]|nr:uncharacterized protein TNCV_1555481 [Trichonephila clavipes]